MLSAPPDTLSTMADPSAYELAAWQHVQRFRGRPLSRSMRNTGERIATGAAALGERVEANLDKHPRVKAAASGAQRVAGKAAGAIGSGAKQAAAAVPDWAASAFDATRQTVGRVSRAGLSPKQIISKHNKRGHDVASLSDLRMLDLEQIDRVRGRGASWYYPATAALTGAGAGLLISGGELVTAASAGAAAAPSGAVVVGAFAGDAAIVLGLASRSVGHVALHYGYDPEEPAEKLFVMSVVNAGTAASATAKTAAMADISRLTQALVRGKTWAILDKSVVSKVSGQFAKAFGLRLTKQGLGKVVPAVGIVIGGALNWTTLEGIVDAADYAYRRRFLIEKYPHLDEQLSGEPKDTFRDAGSASDVVISVLDEIEDAGGPDLR